MFFSIRVIYSFILLLSMSDSLSSEIPPHIPTAQAPEKIGFSLRLFTRNTGPSTLDGHAISFTPEINLNNTDFNAERPRTYFIVHGYFDSFSGYSILNHGNKSWMSEMKDELIKKEDANVFIVDWSKGSHDYNYFQAIADTRVVGDEIAGFIKFAIKYHKLDPSRIHLIGHSLGAHITGYAGMKVPGIGRITGLDPAQPGFEGRPKEDRLDKTDANFVDVIHTNSHPLSGFGLISPVGHVDIYFNGGIDQPRCNFLHRSIGHIQNFMKSIFKVIEPTNVCSHLRAYKYFTATIKNDCYIWARRADTVHIRTCGHFDPVTSSVSDCSQETCIAAGFPAPLFKARGLFAASTYISEYPYCDKSKAGLDKAILTKLVAGT